MTRKLAALAAALFLLLAGCGEESAERAPYDSDDVQALLDAGIFSETPEELSSDIACKLLGVDSELVSQCAAYLPTSTNAEALVLLVLNDAEDARDVEASCQSWLDEQIEAYQDYGPEHVPKLEGAVVSVRGNTILLVVGEDPAAVQTAVDGLE